MKVIKINEEQYNFIWNNIIEGVDYKNNGDGTIDFSINQNKTDKANTGTNSVDTRVFGNKQNILNGDGTANKHSKSLSQQNNNKQSAITFYKNVIEWGKKNDRESIYSYNDPNLPSATYTAVKKWFDNNYSNERIIADATKSLNRITQEAEPYLQKYDRISQENNDENIMRYTTGTVPSTNIKYIALFTMTDFNFSDAIKHGYLRQNGNTDDILGIDKDDRPTNSNGNYQNINLTYDNQSVKPNIAQNFSLNNVKDGHYKQQFGLNGQGGYSSVSQFLDKSVIYANSVLKKVNYIPDFIVSAPSSSSFNEYYCQNLSSKLGKPYVKDFFQRNVVNVKWDDGRDITDMKKQGFSDKDILEFSSQVKGVAFKEIAHIISEPLRQFCSSNMNVIQDITKKMNRQKQNEVHDNDVINCIIKHSYNVIIDNLQNDNITKNLVENFRNNALNFYNPKFNTKQMGQYVMYYLFQRNSFVRQFNQLLANMQQLTLQYTTQLKERGYKLRFDTKKFKITEFKKQFRPFLHNVYVVADGNLNKNGELFSRYQNAKFLIFDEDINSGATLKCAIDALQEKLPNNNNTNILCLVNAYSASGF